MEMKPQKPKLQKPRPIAPKELEPRPCQHIRILDCDKPISRVFYECYYCQQGLLSECNKVPPIREIAVICPNCGRTAIELLAQEVVSTTAIPSPWKG